MYAPLQNMIGDNGLSSLLLTAPSWVIDLTRKHASDDDNVCIYAHWVDLHAGHSASPIATDACPALTRIRVA